MIIDNHRIRTALSNIYGVPMSRIKFRRQYSYVYTFIKQHNIQIEQMNYEYYIEEEMLYNMIKLNMC